MKRNLEFPRELREKKKKATGRLPEKCTLFTFLGNITLVKAKSALGVQLV